MTTQQVTLQHPLINGGVAVRVMCSSITPSFKVNNSANPNANGVGMAEVTTTSFENMMYDVKGVHFTGASNTLTWEHLIALAQLRYGGPTATGNNSAIILNISYGAGLQLKGMGGNTNIRVILKDGILPMSTVETKNAYLPVGSFNLIETV